jgi:hypothetical protein
MKVYIDSECRCHITNQDGTLRDFDVPFFDGRCITFVEGYRYIPMDENWTRSDGVVFHGEMITPWKPYDELDAAQREYEKQILNEYKESLLELGVEV